MNVDFVHIGLPKAASTWLQTGLFRYHPDLQVVTKSGPFSKVEFNVIRDLINVGESEFIVEHWQKRIADELMKNLDQSKITGISEEELSNGGVAHFDEKILPRIRDTLGQTKIILVLRHPINYLRSVYSEYIHKGGTQTLDQFYHPERCERLAKRIDFPQLVRVTKELFGENDVLVLPFEVLAKEGEQAFIDKICDFIGVQRIEAHEINKEKPRRNRGITTASVRLYRVFNTLDNALFVPLFPKRKRIRLHVLLDKFLSRYPIDQGCGNLPLPPVELVLRLQGAREILRNSNFAFWDDEHVAYNYDLGEYNFEKHQPIHSR